MKWTHVEDGLPKDGLFVYVVCRKMGGGKAITRACHRGGEWRFVEPRFRTLKPERVTHWIDLTPPPPPVPVTETGRRGAFLRELTVLTQTYGIVIGGCGCCNSPFLIEHNDTSSAYITNSHYVYADQKADSELAWRPIE